jgi:hypothetical protein
MEKRGVQSEGFPASFQCVSTANPTARFGKRVLATFQSVVSSSVRPCLLHLADLGYRFGQDYLSARHWIVQSAFLASVFSLVKDSP